MTLDAGRKDLKNIPRERWATVLALIFVQKMPEAALTQIVLEGRLRFIKRGLATDSMGLKAEDYSDIWAYIKLAVQNANQQRATLTSLQRAGFVTDN